MKDDDFVSVTIPKKLFEKISRYIRNTSLQAVSKYVTYILEKELSLEERKVYSEKDKEKIKEKLRKLGYF